MKKPPSQVAPSQGRIAARPKKDTTQAPEHKLDDDQDDRPEREIQLWCPTGIHTEAEFNEFIAETLDTLTSEGGES
jgi:hypothetical protein